MFNFYFFNGTTDKYPHQLSGNARSYATVIAYFVFRPSNYYYQLIVNSYRVFACRFKLKLIQGNHISQIGLY